MIGKRLALAVCLVPLAAAAPATAARAPQTPVQPTPLAAPEAAALVEAPSVVTGGTTTRPVSLAQALAAGVVGLGKTVLPSPAASEAVHCAASNAWWQWGTWPYEQRIDETTYWCAVYGQRITSRSTNVTASGTLCGTDSTSNQIISGGIGYTWFVVRATATWACATAIPWITLHPTHHLDTSRNAWGSNEIVGAG